MAVGAPPRMKKGRMPAGRSKVKDRLDIRAASRTTNVNWMPRKYHRLSLSEEKQVGENLTQAWHPIARLSLKCSLEGKSMQVVYERCAGLDVHKRTVVVCAITSEAHSQRSKERRTFSTMTPDLLRMRT